ncbi:MAG: tyrosine-type recombinase/integrase [bacterium]|nr:tyrosine-type recombinase/integrase [bacterium]
MFEDGGRKYFGRSTDKPAAIFNFRQWEARQKQDQVRLKSTRTTCDVYFDSTAGTGRRVSSQRIDLDAFYAKARELILKDPRTFADRVGIPQIGYLEGLKPPEPSPALKEIGAIYQDKAQITRHERGRSKTFWAEFQKAVAVKTIREITQEHIVSYCDAVMSAGQSQTWIKHRFAKVKTVLRFAQNRTKTPEDIERVLTFCRMLSPPRRNAADPHPIGREDFRALLDIADDKWKAVLLCALNFCMYGKEVADIEKPEIDLTNGTLLTDRNKTGVTRIAVLWDRTRSAIRNAPRHRPSRLFLNRAATPYHPDHIRRGFDRLRKAAGVADTVKFSDIRDGAYTAAVQSGADMTLAKLLGGHATGVSDYYVRRNPKMVVDACKAIERAYFA